MSDIRDEVIASFDAVFDAAPEGLWSAYPFGVVWTLGQLGADLTDVPGVEIFVDSDVPVGVGLSSSAAIECAVALALNDVWNLGFSNDVLARAGQLAENTAVGVPTGIMDQFASLYGQPGHANLLDCRSRQITPVELNFAREGLSILFIETATTHEHVKDEYAQRRAACELLDESHRSLRDDFSVSTPSLDLAVETALAHGALGARMIGGGFGGCAIALIPSENESLLRVAIDGAFAEHGFGQPDSFGVSACVGAQRDA